MKKRKVGVQALGLPTISVAVSDDEIDRCFPAYRRARPALTLGVFRALIAEMKGQGYRIVRVEDSGQVGSVAGYRIRQTLLMGKVLHIEDLLLADHPLAREHAAALIDWLSEEAKREGCASVKMDVPHNHADGQVMALSRGFRSVAVHLDRLATAHLT